jgi:hypothetical protein
MPLPGKRPRQHKLCRLAILGLETWLLVEIVRQQGRIALETCSGMQEPG